MSNANERLTEVFDRGARNGIETLSLDERALYSIQDFILDFEMGGLSGYLYNHIRDIQQIRNVCTAMRQRRMTPLANLLEEAIKLFCDYRDDPSAQTWSSILLAHDPQDRISAIEAGIASLDDYGLNTAEIA